MSLIFIVKYDYRFSIGPSEIEPWARSKSWMKRWIQDLCWDTNCAVLPSRYCAPSEYAKPGEQAYHRLMPSPTMDCSMGYTFWRRSIQKVRELLLGFCIEFWQHARVSLVLKPLSRCWLNVRRPHLPTIAGRVFSRRATVWFPKPSAAGSTRSARKA